MTSNGELIYTKIVTAMAEKASTRFITGRDTQRIGRYFWSMLNEDFKQQQKQEHGKEAFWQFALQLKSCLINNDLSAVNSLYSSFDQNALNYHENLFNNYLKNLVDHIL